MKTQVIITFQLEGMHCWPQAREVFPDVGFLSDPHRHMFHFKLAKRVNHDDRDVEFIRWKRSVQHYLTEQYSTGQFKTPLYFQYRSCEMLAKELLTEFDCDWVEVWEDGENGARVEK